MYFVNGIQIFIIYLPFLFINLFIHQFIQNSILEWTLINQKTDHICRFEHYFIEQLNQYIYIYVLNMNITFIYNCVCILLFIFTFIINQMCIDKKYWKDLMKIFNTNYYTICLHHYIHSSFICLFFVYFIFWHQSFVTFLYIYSHCGQ